MADGVIETITGDLLRAGYSYPDEEFDSVRETIRYDVPEPFYIRGFRNANFHRWNGSSWDLVPQGAPRGLNAAEHKIETILANRVVRTDYYMDEIKAASGFSGFSGLVATEFYVYSGSKYYGFSEISYDSIGEVWTKTFHPITTTGSTNIYRKFKK